MTAKEKVQIIEWFSGHKAFGLPVTISDIEKYLSTMVSDPEPTPHKPTKISELGENDVIHTETEAEYYRISILLHLAGKTWANGYSYLDSFLYSNYSYNTCLGSVGTLCDIDYFKEYEYNIIPSTQITQP